MKTVLVPLVGLLLVAAACTSEAALAGDPVASLHTAQSDEQQPLVSLEGIEQLARVVASRL